MRRVVQPYLRRGHVADWLGLLLFLSLLIVLVISCYTGVKSLHS
jgi:hypothetical protein